MTKYNLEEFKKWAKKNTNYEKFSEQEWKSAFEQTIIWTKQTPPKIKVIRVSGEDENERERSRTIKLWTKERMQERERERERAGRWP